MDEFDLSTIGLDKFLDQLVGDGAILFSTSPQETPVELDNLILAQKGISISLTEALEIVEKSKNNILHKDYVTISGGTCKEFCASKEVLITSIQDRSFYGVSTNTNEQSGIVLCKTVKSLLLGVYSGLLEEVVPLVEEFAETLPQ